QVDHFCSGCGSHCDVHSFPTRRSSDLDGAGPARAARRCPSTSATKVRRAMAMLRAMAMGAMAMPRAMAMGAMAMLRARAMPRARSEEHTSELQSRSDLVCRLLLEKKK